MTLKVPSGTQSGRRLRLRGRGLPRPDGTRGDLYAPYWWDVRLFTPGKIEEAVIRFRPDGAPYGFQRRVPETYIRNPATKALDAGQAGVHALEAGRQEGPVVGVDRGAVGVAHR